MAAAASSASDEKPSCCPPGSLGAAVVLDDARTLLGKIETIAVSGGGGDGDAKKKTVETPVYVVAPPEGTALKGTVVAIYDIFGLNGGRFKSVCDALALAGFAVAGPDFYGKGTSITDVGGFGSDGGNALLKANTWEDQADGTPGVGAKVAAAAALLQSRFGGEGGGDQKKPGVIGFCWGAYMTFRACADADAFACGVSCHPAYKLAEFMFNSTQEELAKAVASPQLIMPAGNDPENIKEGGDLLKLLTNGHEVHTFEDQTHGWVTRGDTNDAAVKAAVEKAITYAIDFFTAKL